MLDVKKTEEKMIELAKVLQYEYKDISWLKKAMYAQKISGSKSHKNYANDTLATLGDSVLKCILTEYFYDKEENKEYITEKKKGIENNKTLCELFNELKLSEFVYNDEYFYGDAPKHNQLTNKGHNQYIEAIIGAIFKDKGFQYAREWTITFFKRNEKLS